jgi:hypothetical protein
MLQLSLGEYSDRFEDKELHLKDRARGPDGGTVNRSSFGKAVFVLIRLETSVIVGYKVEYIIFLQSYQKMMSVFLESRV